MTDTPQIKTALPGPKAQAIIARDSTVVSPSYTRGYPFVIERGDGSMVEDVDGNVFLDCAAGIAVNSTGHSHPDVVKAITEQAQKFLHMSGTDFYYEPQVRLAEELASIVPIQGGVRSFFGNSGTEAIEACLKLARYATGRQNIIAFFGAFHGRSMGSLSLTASKAIQRRGFGPLMPGVYHAPYPDRYRCPLGSTPETCAAACVDFIEHELFTHLVSPDEVAADRRRADSGRGRLHRGAGRVPAAAARADDASTASCWSPTKCSPAWAAPGRCSRWSSPASSPTSMAIAKGIASGLPLGVAVARAGLMAWPPGAHASTFGGNPVSCAAAIATIRLLKDRLVANAADVGAHLMSGLTDAGRQAPADRRRARPRPDDWRRARARSPDEGTRHRRARRRRQRRVRARAAGARRGEERGPLLAAAGADARAGGHGGRRSSTRR